MFGWEFPPHITGGLGTACFGLTRAMAMQGDSVIFVVPKAYGDESAEAIRLVNASNVVMDFSSDYYKDYWQRLSYVQVNSRLVPYVGEDDFYKIITSQSKEETTIIEGNKRKFAFSGKYTSLLMEEVEKYAMVAATIAKDYTYDIIHAHDWLTYKAGVVAKEVSGKKLVIHVHATEFDRSGENINRAVYDIEKYGMDMADHIVCVSDFTRNIVISRYGQPEWKISTLHNGANSMLGQNTSSIQRVLKEKVVTFLGRVTFQKGPDYFVEAAAKVLQQDSNVRFVMAGSGDMLNRMISLVAKKRISKNFHFTGFLRGEDVNRMFALSDVYVMPSVSEPFGISPLEAMSSGVPVIISKQSGVSEVLKYALKVDFWDIDAMANDIYSLLHYPALSRMLSRNGEHEAGQIRWEDTAIKLRNLYVKLLK